jgi:hypothetical protein
VYSDGTALIRRQLTSYTYKCAVQCENTARGVQCAVYTNDTYYTVQPAAAAAVAVIAVVAAIAV